MCIASVDVQVINKSVIYLDFHLPPTQSLETHTRCSAAHSCVVCISCRGQWCLTHICILFTHVSLARCFLQVEYVRQRGIVLQELRQAKAEAEEERRKILARIGSSLVDGAWR